MYVYMYVYMYVCMYVHTYNLEEPECLTPYDQLDNSIISNVEYMLRLK